MKPYNKKDIENIYGDFIRSAHNNCKKYRFNQALKDIETAAEWAYRFNNIYTDDKTEKLLKRISDLAIEHVSVENKKDDHCVLIDSFLLDNRGLTQQYLRSLMNMGMHILVIFTNAGGYIGNDIFAEIEAYDKAKLVSFQEGIDRIYETKQIVQEIESFSPSHIFLHIAPWDVIALMACNSIEGPIKYNINLTDHAYWLGASFIDYCFEFRPYGMTVSLEKRGLKSEQCLALPFYPISPIMQKFAGIPEIPQNAVKIFTGGALYKMLGRNDIFFNILERFLAIGTNIYILVAGFSQDKRFDDKIALIEGHERILQIGVRKDIDAVFDHCDIYLGTYPMTGGLMVQYAAKHGKPVVSYHERGDVMNAVEEFLNTYQQEFQSFSDLDEMVAYTKKLVENAEFRLQQGRLLQTGMMNCERFNSEFCKLISTHHSSFEWKNDSIDYDSFFHRYLDLENNNGNTATRAILSAQKLNVFFKLKSNRLKVLQVLLLVLKNTYLCRLF